MRFAVIISIYQSSVLISGYSAATSCAMREKRPSVCFIMFALVTMATFFLPFCFAYSKAARAIRFVPDTVVTLKSIAISGVISRPLLPKMYSPSLFSLKKVQSMPSPGILTGRTFANKSSSRRIQTFALSSVPPCGVAVGPFRITSHFLSFFKTSSGMALPHFWRFSKVKPSILTSEILPLFISFSKIFSRTKTAFSIITGPMPSPSHIPIMIFSFFEKSVLSVFSFMRLFRSICDFKSAA